MVTNPPQIEKVNFPLTTLGIINNQQNYESRFGEFQIGGNKPQRLLNDK